MTQLRKTAPILVVDPDDVFLKTLTDDPAAVHMPPVTSRIGKEAQFHLSDAKKTFAGVFISTTVTNNHYISVIRSSRSTRPATPVFLIYEGELPHTEKEMKTLGIEKALPKPLKYKDLTSLVGPVVQFFDDSQAMAIAKQNADQLNQEVNAEDEKFRAIRAENFLAGTKSFFDVYVRLGSGKYLKLIQAGDAFTFDRVTNYIQKGVTHFYLRKEAQETYLAFCDKLATAMLKSDKVDIKIKSAHTLNQGQETLQLLKDSGISENNLTYAASFTNNVNELIKQMNPGRNPIIKGFLNDMSSYDHAVGVTMISSMLINSLQMTSADPVETVGMAAMLHDVGIFKLGLSEFDEDESRMNAEQHTNYLTHPLVSVEILKSVPRLKPAVLQAVEQHHERRNRRGFPNQLGSGSISMIADVIGISDEFHRILQKIKKDPKTNFPELLQTRIFSCFNNALTNEFKRIFITPGAFSNLMKVQSPLAGQTPDPPKKTDAQAAAPAAIGAAAPPAAAGAATPDDKKTPKAA